MGKTIYDSHRADEFFSYGSFENFMRRQKGSELVQSRGNESDFNYQIWNLNGVTVQYIVEQRLANDHTKINLFGTTRKIGEVEKIILAEAEKHK
jgi:hypothetical protein